MLFSQEERGKIHLENPHHDNRNVSKILGEKWYSLSQHQQQQYKIRAKQLNDLNKEQLRRSVRLQSNNKATSPPPPDPLEAFAQVFIQNKTFLKLFYFSFDKTDLYKYAKVN